MWWIIGIIVAVVIIIWLVVRKKSSKKMNVNPLTEYLNHEALVTESISDTLGTGKVNIGGKEFQARKGGTGVINIGSKVTIIDVGYNSLIVKNI